MAKEKTHSVRQGGDNGQGWQNTHSVYIDRRQIIWIGVRWGSGTVWIKRTRNLQELFSEISDLPTRGDLERAVGAVRWPTMGNLVRFCLRAGTGDSRGE